MNSHQSGPRRPYYSSIYAIEVKSTDSWAVIRINLVWLFVVASLHCHDVGNSIGNKVATKLRLSPTGETTLRTTVLQ